MVYKSQLKLNITLHDDVQLSKGGNAQISPEAQKNRQFRKDLEALLMREIVFKFEFTEDGAKEVKKKKFSEGLLFQSFSFQKDKLVNRFLMKKRLVRTFFNKEEVNNLFLISLPVSADWPFAHLFCLLLYRSFVILLDF